MHLISKKLHPKSAPAQPSFTLLFPFWLFSPCSWRSQIFQALKLHFVLFFSLLFFWDRLAGGSQRSLERTRTCACAPAEIYESQKMLPKLFTKWSFKREGLTQPRRLSGLRVGRRREYKQTFLSILQNPPPGTFVGPKWSSYKHRSLCPPSPWALGSFKPIFQ